MDYTAAISNAIGYYIILQNFFKEYKKIEDDKVKHGIYLLSTMFPTRVISLLEIEMIFKAKLAIEGTKYSTKSSDGHNISLLFSQLPEKTKSSISSTYEQKIQNYAILLANEHKTNFN